MSQESISENYGCGCNSAEPIENKECVAGQVDSQFCRNCDHMLAFTGVRWKHFFLKGVSELCNWRK